MNFVSTLDAFHISDFLVNTFGISWRYLFSSFHFPFMLNRVSIEDKCKQENKVSSLGQLMHLFTFIVNKRSIMRVLVSLMEKMVQEMSLKGIKLNIVFCYFKIVNNLYFNPTQLPFINGVVVAAFKHFTYLNIQKSK